MEVKIIEEKDNPFLERKEVLLRIEHHSQPTPSKKELEDYLTKKYGVDATHIVIDYIFSEVGIGESKAKVKIYKKPVREVEKKEEAEQKEGKEAEATAQQQKAEEKEGGAKGETQA